jgi:hypothetical protein
MAKPFPSVPVLAALGVTLMASAAQAQFGSIFQPPRPPADIGRSAPPPSGGLPQMPPEEMDEDAPPPPPPQRSLPPPGASRQPQYQQQPQFQQQPPQGAVRSQPLPPPPGAAAPPQQSALPPGQNLPPVQNAPGQPQPRGAPPPANAAPQPGDEVITEMPSQKIANPTAIFTGLDKVTGRIITFDVALNETVQFGALQVTPRICYTRPPTESANTDSFVEVDEVTLQGEVKRIFTGWMFASSPGLHAVEHPIYDVWLTNCKGGTTVVADTPPPAPPQGQRGQQQRSQQPAQPRQPVQQPTLQNPRVGPPPGLMPPPR